MNQIKNLYRKDLILKSQAKTKESVLEEIYLYLRQKDLVKDSFLEAITEREEIFPTGINLAPVGDSLPNLAIPHTDTEHCKSKVIVFVKLEEPIPFYNMINPSEELAAHYLFILVNDQKNNKTNVLSELMAFVTNEKNMHQLEELDSAEDIYEFLTQN